MAKVILTFNWDGTVEKEAIGFQGKTCTEQTKFLEEALGATGEKKRFKPEYLDETPQDHNNFLKA